MAEGGFKSIHNPSSANDYLLATNLTLGVWKWVEAYADLGLVKNRSTKAKSFFGSGIRLNMVPDYLEIFFPVYGSDGFAFDETPYEQKIRFILTLSSNKLFSPCLLPYSIALLFSSSIIRTSLVLHFGLML